MSSNNKEDKINIPNIVGIAPAIDIKCAECGKVWSGNPSDPQHYSWCSSYKPLPTTYTCSECNAYSTVSESAIEHYEWCSKYKPPVITDFTCEKCGKKFTNYADYSAHLKSEHAVNYPNKCDICGAAYGAHRHLCTQESEAGYWGLNQYSSYYTYQDDVLKKHFNYAKTGVFNFTNFVLNIYLITLLKYIDLYPEDPILSGRGDDIIEDIKNMINSVGEDLGYKGVTITEYNQLLITDYLVYAYLISNMLDELGINLFDITSMFWRLEAGTKYTILYDKILFNKLNKDNKNQIAIFKDMEFSSYYIPNKYSSKIKYTVEVNVTGDTDYTVTPSAIVEINPIFNNYYDADTKTGCVQYYKELDMKSDTYTVQFYGPPCSKFHDMASGIKLGSIKDQFIFTRAAMYLNDSIVDETTDQDTFLMPNVEQKDGDHVKVVVDLDTDIEKEPMVYQNVPIYLTYVDKDVNPSQGVSGRTQITLSSGGFPRRGFYNFSNGYEAGNTPQLLSTIDSITGGEWVKISITPNDSFSYLETDMTFLVPPYSDTFKRVDFILKRIKP